MGALLAVFLPPLRGRAPDFSKPSRWMLVCLSLAWLASVGGAEAAVRIESLSAGAGALRFRDSRLHRQYGTRLAAEVGIRFLAPYRLSPALSVGIARADEESRPSAFVSESSTSMILIPTALQLPIEIPLAGAWSVRTGPQAVWAYFRESWSATVPEAGIFSDAAESGGWLGAGWLGEIRWQAGPRWSVGLHSEWNWTAGERATARGNEERKTDMDGGWGSIGIFWSLLVR
ncbi:MAG: hypothetical protein KA123_01460 [Candidatus Eisenbacteria bacterium]|nr:hypothetical protein [Candidatus Eisenbacteria bacterium]